MADVRHVTFSSSLPAFLNISFQVQSMDDFETWKDTPGFDMHFFVEWDFDGTQHTTHITYHPDWGWRATLQSEIDATVEGTVMPAIARHTINASFEAPETLPLVRNASVVRIVQFIHYTSVAETYLRDDVDPPLGGLGWTTPNQEAATQPDLPKEPKNETNTTQKDPSGAPREEASTSLVIAPLAIIVALVSRHRDQRS